MHKTTANHWLVHTAKILFIPIILVMLFVGLQQKGYNIANNVHWRPELGGLTFAPHSLANTAKGFHVPDNGDGFNIELLITPEYQSPLGFQFIMLLYGKSSATQLLIGQWDRSLVIMNGADYSNKKHEPKLYIPLGAPSGKKNILVATGPQGTSVSIDGILIHKSQKITLVPPPSHNCRLVLGNSASGRNSWSGTIHRLVISPRNQDDYTIRYDFNKSGGNFVKAQTGNSPDILLPSRLPILHKTILLWPDFSTVNRDLLLFDISINVFGFLPLGFLMPIVLQGLRLQRNGYIIIASLLFIFFFSLSIEVAQIWIPSRHSSLLDLVLNTFGGAIGIFASRRIVPRLRIE